MRLNRKKKKREKRGEPLIGNHHQEYNKKNKVKSKKKI